MHGSHSTKFTIKTQSLFRARVESGFAPGARAPHLYLRDAATSRLITTTIDTQDNEIYASLPPGEYRVSIDFCLSIICLTNFLTLLNIESFVV